MRGKISDDFIDCETREVRIPKKRRVVKEYCGYMIKQEQLVRIKLYKHLDVMSFCFDPWVGNRYTGEETNTTPYTRKLIRSSSSSVTAYIY